MSSLLIYISSDDRTLESRSTSDFTVNFNNNNILSRVRHYNVKSLSVPNVSNNIYAVSDSAPGNNIFTYSSGSITISPGHYSLAQLITAIQADALAIADSMVITTNPITGKLVFTTSGPVSYYNIAGGNPMGYILGIGTNAGPTAALSADNLPDLSGINNIFVESSALSAQSTQMIFQKKSRQFIVDIPINEAPYGSYFNYETQHSDLDLIMPSTNYFNLNSIDIKLRDPLNRIIDLHGLQFNITLRIYYDP